MKRIILVILMCILSFRMFAQFGPDYIPTQIIHPDNSVSFTMAAPEAKSVKIVIGMDHFSMTNDGNGLWSVTTTPIEPGFHYYFLEIDGASVVNPASEAYFGFSKTTSGIDIPEEGTDYLEIKDVPHGQVRMVNYYSEVEKEWRPMCVYTPPGYEKGKKKYPVLYIQHGGGEDQRGWVSQGKMANIMDNLIAEGKAVPMILVAANGNVRMQTPDNNGYTADSMEPFRREMLENIIPYVDKTFRTKKGPKNRGMCGLSMGSGQTFYIGLRAPEVFGYIGMFSSGIFGGISTSSAPFDIEAEMPGVYTDTNAYNSQHKLFYISCGEQDNRITYTTRVVEELKAHGVKVTFETYPGNHDWQPWRKSLHSFAQMLFK